jgi:chaperone BCS1
VVVHDSSSKDKVDLSGLLNVLDGIVDTPGRIFVMTSNHPEKLDSALIRPGRVDKILHLSYMGPDEATEMVEHYFQCVLTSEQDQKLSKLLSYGLAKGPDGGQGVSAADPTDFANYKNHERAVAEAAARANTKGKVVFTPAELEQMCAEHDTIDEFLTALNNRVGIFELDEELVRPGNSRQISLSNQDVIDTLGTQLAGKGVLQARPLTRDGMGGLKRQISL